MRRGLVGVLISLAVSRHNRRVLGLGNRSLETARLENLKKGVITKEVSSLEESLEAMKSLSYLEYLESGRTLLCLPHFEDSLESLESPESPDAIRPLEAGHF